MKRIYIGTLLVLGLLCGITYLGRRTGQQMPPEELVANLGALFAEEAARLVEPGARLCVVIDLGSHEVEQRAFERALAGFEKQAGRQELDVVKVEGWRFPENTSSVVVHSRYLDALELEGIDLLVLMAAPPDSAWKGDDRLKVLCLVPDDSSDIESLMREGKVHTAIVRRLPPAVGEREWPDRFYTIKRGAT